MRPKHSFAFLIMSTITRNKAQEQAVVSVYDVLTYLDMKEPVDVQMIVSGVTGVSYEDSDFFVKAVVVSAIKHYGEIVALFNAHMDKWTFDRLNRLEQAILLSAYSEYNYLEEKIDKAVVINVAVDLAKKFLDAKDYKFVNAILDKVLVKHE
jgi:transcription antitermination protein NusB